VHETEPELSTDPVAKVVGEPTEVPLSRRELRASRSTQKALRPPARLTVTGVLGEVLITAGVLVMLFLGWYIWLNDIVTGGEQQEAAEVVQQELQDQYDRGESSAERPTDPGEPVVSTAPPAGQVFGALIVPRFGADYVRSIATGVDVETVLNSRRIGIGHYTDTQMPGEIGNFAIAAHRNTWGGAFSDVDKLRLGDRIYVETVDGWYEYSFRGLEYVWPTGVDVLEPVPTAPGVAATDRILTMTTCNPRFSTAERIVAYAVFETWYPRAGGPPAEISGVVEARG
jgi:sortase A